MKKIYTIVKITLKPVIYNFIEDGNFSHQGLYTIIGSHKSEKIANSIVNDLQTQNDSELYFVVVNSYNEQSIGAFRNAKKKKSFNGKQNKVKHPKKQNREETMDTSPQVSDEAIGSKKRRGRPLGSRNKNIPK